MKLMNRFFAGAGLWLLVLSGVGLILRYAEISKFEITTLCLLMLFGSVLFAVYHDSED